MLCIDYDPIRTQSEIILLPYGTYCNNHFLPVHVNLFFFPSQFETGGCDGRVIADIWITEQVTSGWGLCFAR